MFTGIVKTQGDIVAIDEKLNAKSFEVRFPIEFAYNLQKGASVAINGCCLTVIGYKYVVDGQELTVEQLNNPASYNYDQNATYAQVRFDLMSITLEITNLGLCQVGSKVNAERSYKVGDEVGGHILSGHIDTKAPIVKLLNHDNIYQLEFELDSKFKNLIIDKGFIGVDGMSLTVSSVTEKGFTVNLIPETLAITTISTKKIGDFVNIEIDNQTKVISATVEVLLKSRGLI